MTALQTRKAIQTALKVTADGVIGPKTRAAFAAATGDTAKFIQRALGFQEKDVDGIMGARTRAVFDSLAKAEDDFEWPVVGEVPAGTGEIHHVKASSFADPADVRAFRKCKAEGKSDQQCFKVGDNGIGKWGDDTTADVPMCALPPEDWKPFGAGARGKKVIVTCDGKTVVCELRDTMPRKVNIHNGAGIDLNPAAWAALGHGPPQLRAATWQWA